MTLLGQRKKAQSLTPRRSGRTMLRVYQTLREQILDGALSQGSHLSIQNIANTIESSNGPVISALGRLAHEGLVVHERGQGYRVAEWTPELLDDLLVVRRALEVEAARLAARRTGPEDIHNLRDQVARMAEIVEAGDRAGADRADVDLHTTIAQLSRSVSLIEALQRSHMLEIVHRRLLINEPRGDFLNLAVNHATLVEAIASGDPDLAGRTMHLHLTNRAAVQSRLGS